MLDQGASARQPAFGQVNQLLQRLPPQDMARLRPHLRSVELRRGDILCEARGAIKRVYFPLGGMVSFLAVMQTGEMIETAVVGRDGIVGGSVIDDNWQSFVQITAQIPGEALQLDSVAFAKVSRESAALREIVRRYQAVILLQAQQNAACHALHSIEARFARWLLQSQDVLASPTIHLTQDFLSQMLGVRRTSVSLVAHMLQQAEVIEYSRGRIHVLDRSRLEQCACECYPLIREETNKVLALAAS
jgi:CRP-like cAMP-binding protein